MAVTRLPLEERHPGTQQLMRWLTPNPNLTGVAQHVSSQFHKMAILLVGELADGPELTAGLRKLLESKDCCVRQAITDLGEEVHEALMHERAT